MDTEVVVVDGPGARDYGSNDYYPVEECEVRLVNNELWSRFHEVGTEMIITKSGRRMFPPLIVKLSRLDPNADYCVYLEMDLAHRCRFKFTSSGGWSAAGNEEPQSPHRIYTHPESPSKGSQWMSQDVSFSRVKLTNTCSPPPGQLVLSSMHKYQPKIIIVKSPNVQALGWVRSKLVIFPETRFIAVTAYQNEKITKLKINHNPFAKGFRENGKSNTKRKQVCDGPDSPTSKKSGTPSPPPQERVDDRVKNTGPVMPFYNGYYYRSYPFYNQWWSGPVPLYYHPYDMFMRQEATKPKKITDFSINAIMNN